MVSSTYQTFINDSYARVATRQLMVGGAYYDESWAVMSLLMMTGNFLDYTAYQPTTQYGTPLLALARCIGEQGLIDLARMASSARRRRVCIAFMRGDARTDGVHERAAIGDGRVAVDRQLARVDERAVLGHREVQVRAGRQAGRADEADHVLLLDLLPGAQPARELRQVVVAGRRARSRAR